MFLMPSRFEPCGLNQLYSLRYGTVPVVRATGGLADTIVDATTRCRRSATANGFSFQEYSPLALSESLRQACDAYAARKSGANWSPPACGRTGRGPAAPSNTSSSTKDDRSAGGIGRRQIANSWDAPDVRR